jgi:flagellar biosynthesis protein FlhA
MEYGAMIPLIRVHDDIRIAPNAYRFHIKNVEIDGGEIMFDHYMAINPGYVEEEIEGIETFEPYMHHPALWITEGQRERAEAFGYTVVDAPSIIATHLTEIIKSHLYELLTRQDVQTILDHVRQENPVLLDELIPKQLSVGDVQKVLSNLLKEGISIRDIVTILETLADYAPSTRDMDMLTLYVRQALKRSISKRFLGEELNSVITLDPELEQTIMNSIQQTEHGSYLALDPQITQKIFDSLQNELSKLKTMGLQPLVLASPLVRLYFKRLVEQIEPELVVLSYYEVESGADVQSVGMVSIK